MVDIAEKLVNSKSLAALTKISMVLISVIITLICIMAQDIRDSIKHTHHTQTDILIQMSEIKAQVIADHEMIAKLIDKDLSRQIVRSN